MNVRRDGERGAELLRPNFRPTFSFDQLNRSLVLLFWTLTLKKEIVGQMLDAQSRLALCSPPLAIA